MVKGFVRCGICDKNFQSSEEWDEHAKTNRHRELVARWMVLFHHARATGEHITGEELIKKARGEM